jgi:hypothetical protein
MDAPDTPLSRPPLGFPTRPEDLVIDEFGNRVRIYHDPEISCWQPLPLRSLSADPIYSLP